MAIGKVPGSGNEDEAADAVFADINITPLTDVMLVLLIIFMVTSSVIVNREGSSQAGLKVNLPSGNAADVRSSQNDLSVALLSDGRLVLSGNVIDEAELEKALAEAKARNPDTLVIVQADEGVPHGRVVHVMERAKEAGLGQLAIGVREQSK